MDDDFNTSLGISYLLEAIKLINKELTSDKKISRLLAINELIKMYEYK